MTDNLIREINKRNNIITEFCDHFKVKRTDIPKDLLESLINEAQSDDQNDLRADSEWRQGVIGGPEPGPTGDVTFRSREGGPRRIQVPSNPSASEGPQPGEFIVVNGRPEKIVDVYSQFGNTSVKVTKKDGSTEVFLANELAPYRTIGKVRIYRPIG